MTVRVQSVGLVEVGEVWPASRKQGTNCPFLKEDVAFFIYLVKSFINIQSQNKKNEQFLTFYTMFLSHKVLHNFNIFHSIFPSTCLNSLSISSSILRDEAGCTEIGSALETTVPASMVLKPKIIQANSEWEPNQELKRGQIQRPKA